MVSVSGFIFISFLSLSAWVGSIFILIPWIILLPFSLYWYRFVCDWISQYWFYVPISFIELVHGTKNYFYGQNFNLANDRCIVISNHRTRLDWMFLWMWILRFGRLRNYKIILKDDLKKSPGFGWAMQMFGFLFLNRDWKIDEERIRNSLEHYTNQDYPLQILLFPEGTDLSESNRKKVKNLPKKMVFKFMNMFYIQD